MLTYLSKFSAEDLIALARFSSELGISPRQEPAFNKLMVIGPGRIYLKFFRALDAADEEGVASHVENRNGDYVRIDGWESPPGASEVELRMKWQQRARFFIRENFGELQHISDWLYMCSLGDQAWVNDVDEFDRPRKLMKCGSLERLLHEADKHMLRLHQTSAHDKLASVRMDAGHERHVADLGLGYTVIRLLTADALAVEGAALRHCVGQGAYADKLRSEDYGYFSIRDPSGKRLATVETHLGVMIQFRARFNLKPERHLLDLVDGVRGDLGWVTREEDEERRRASPAHALVAAASTQRRP